MMKITLFALIISAGILTSCNVNAKYRKQGNHWFESGKVPNDKDDTKLYVEEGKQEYEELFDFHNASMIAEKYIEDCVYMHQDLGVLRGREAIRDAYDRVFDSGKHSVELETQDVELLKTGAVQAIAVGHYFDEDHNSMGASRILVILKHDGDDGYKTQYKAEFTEYAE
ncbi:uncharacterized protein [Amphiura filiformis]|uniref:uncharacterized protein n=1 Tax=Amphiura filiformis TaxID=82378 RepID=UPI003B20BC0F